MDDTIIDLSQIGVTALYFLFHKEFHSAEHNDTAADNYNSGIEDMHKVGHARRNVVNPSGQNVTQHGKTMLLSS